MDIFSLMQFLVMVIGISTISNCLELPQIYSYYNLAKNVDDMTECEIVLENFAQSSSNYTLCAIRHSQPVHACEMCVDHYIGVLSAHNKILNAEVNGTKCKDKLIHLDRFEIVESVFTDVQDLWFRGFCDKCFEWIDGIPQLSNDTKKFFNYFEIAHECISSGILENNILHDNNTDKICKRCMVKYLQLNSFYDSLKGASQTNEICMDIVDSMNATRSFWSGVLNCCRLRKTPEIIFLCCTGIITTLPVIFYLAAKIFSESATRISVRSQHQFNETTECLPTTSTEENT